MNPNINKHLQLSIDITLDLMSKASLLGAALSHWAELHGDISGSSDAAYDIREAALQLDEHLSQLKGHLTSAPAVPPQQAAKIPAKTFHPERVGDGLEALTEAYDVLTVFETALNEYRAKCGTADVEVAGDRLIAIARQKIFDGMLVMQDVKGHLRSCKGGCDE